MKNFLLTEEVNYGVTKLFKLNLYILCRKLLWSAFRTEENLSLLDNGCLINFFLHGEEN